MFLSGSAIPFMMLPEWMQRLARLIPTTYINEAMQAIIVRGEGLATQRGPLAILALTSVVGITLNGLLFRWESEEPVRPTRLLLALGGLAGLYAAAYFFAPSLGMATYRPDN